MTCRRYVAVAADVFDHPLFLGEEYSRRDAWLWLVAHAAWKDHRVRLGNAMADVKRGQVVAARAHLAKVWNWGEKRVRNFLDTLESEKMIKKGQSEGRLPVIVTICNYERFQEAKRTKAQPGASSRAGSGPVEGQLRASWGPVEGHTVEETTKEVSKNPYNPQGDAEGELPLGEPTPIEQPKAVKPRQRRRGVEAPESYPPEFETLWQSYPSAGRQGKAKGFEYWSEMPQARRDKLPGCVARYKAKLAKYTRSDFTPRPRDFSGFLNPAPSSGGANHTDYIDHVSEAATAAANGHVHDDPSDRWRRPEFAMGRR